LVHQQESLWLQEASPDSELVSTYPTYRCRLETQTQNIQLAEVYWGDLSRVCQGWLGAIIGLFQILFGLRYVAYVAADQPGFWAAALKRLGLAIERILQGPVLAITTMMAVLTVMLCGAELLWPVAAKSVSWNRILVLFSCGFALAISTVARNLSRRRVFERYWFWLNVTAAFLGTVCLARLFYLDSTWGIERIEKHFSGVYWYCRLLVCLLGSLWTVEILLLVSVAIVTAGASLNPRNHRRTIQVGALLPALSIGLWSHVLILFWLLAADQIEKHVGLIGFRDIFKHGIPLLGVQFLMSGLLGGSLLYSFVRYVIWRNFRTVRDFERGDRPPRLIVEGQVLFILALSAVTGSMLVMVTQFNHWMGHDYHDYWYGKFLAECNKWALSMLLPSGFLTVFLLPKLRPLFGIVLEIVNHFVFQSKGHDDEFDNDEQFDVRRTTFEHGTMIFARREIVLQRMKRILLYYRDSMQNRKHPMDLVIVSHSQGTMIAIDVLNSPDMDCISEFSQVSLVTMGSPFTNLYQHYFPNFYPSLRSTYWKRIKQRLHQWTNIFRIDDPVGTEIDFSEASLLDPNQQLKLQVPIKGFANIPLGCRGHMNYWNDREVLGILRSDVMKSEWEATDRILETKHKAA
jgi:hypothetical protein